MSAAKSVCLVAAVTSAALAASALFFSSSASAVESVRAMPRIDVSFSSSRSPVREAAFMSVAPGMSRDAITALLGTPAHTMRFPLSKTTAWDYPYVDSWGYASEFSVLFDDGGTVVGKVTARNDY